MTTPQTVAIAVATVIVTVLAVGSVYELIKGFRTGRFAKRIMGKLTDSDLDYAYRDRDSVSFAIGAAPYFAVILMDAWFISIWFR